MHTASEETLSPAPDSGPLPSEPADLLSKIDALVEPAPEAENVVLIDQARIVRWTGPLFGLFSVILLPWTIYVGESLPSRQLSPNYDAAWAGFDLILLAALASTAYFALRRSRYLSSAASATAALLVVDAWFDVMTTPANQRWESILLAAAVELPLAAVCIWLSHHTEQLAARRLTLLSWRRSRDFGKAPAGQELPPKPGSTSTSRRGRP
jgi:hypothetical protein